MNPLSGEIADADQRFSAAELVELRRRASELKLDLWTLLTDEIRFESSVALKRLAGTLDWPTLDMPALRALDPLAAILPHNEAAQRNCLLIRAGDSMMGVLTDPFDLSLQTWMQSRVESVSVVWHLTCPNDLKAWFAMVEEQMRAIDSILPTVTDDATDGGGVADLSLRSIAADENPVIRLVNSTVFDALRANASDIHLETATRSLVVKYRIDGVLVQIAEVPGRELADQTISRIKVMAELDIAERRIPQDGRFKRRIQDREIDFRVSVMPSLFGEDVVIRLLDKRSLTDAERGLHLEALGFDTETLGLVRRLAREPYGMLLVTGPTGSGKTTTLYAALSEINTGQDKIVTIEDPIEYQVPGILQIPVNEKKGLSFARGLRSILRHDPDKILVGEIRDPETAQIAVQSALTGHLVYTSVHANNVFDVLGRFTHMGVDIYSFVSALNGVLAQRLMRTICPDCAVPYSPSEEEIANSAITVEAAQSMMFRRGAGCGLCRGTGYKGRCAIGEVLRMSDELREMISSRAPIRAIKEVARKAGTRYLRDAAVALVARGQTTLDELNRVTFAE